MLGLLRHGAGVFVVVLTVGAGAAFAQDPAPPPADPGQTPPQPAGVGPAGAKPAQEPAPEGQQPPEGAGPATLPSHPFTGLFGGAAPVNRQRDSLDLTGSIFAVNLTQRPVGPATDQTFVYGTSRYGGGGASLDYNHAWDHANVGLGGSEALAYVSELTDQQGGPWVNRWWVNGDASFNHQLSQRATVNGGAQAIYSPYYSQGLLTIGDIPSVGRPPVTTPGLDFVVAKTPSITSNLIGGLSYSLTQHGSLQFQYLLTRHDFLTSGYDSLRDQLILGRYVYQVNRYVDVHAGYGYRTSQSGSNEPTKSHEIDVGANAGRGYQVARRTTFSFSTGSTVFVSQPASEPGGAGNPTTRFFFIGNANLVQGWARSWSANVGGGQSVQYEPGFQGPFLSQDVYAGFGGLITTRMDLQTQVSYTTGTVGFGSVGNGYKSSTATSTLRFALTRGLAAFAQGFYYKYSFESGVALPTYLPPGLERYGASVGLTTWVPLLGGKVNR